MPINWILLIAHNSGYNSYIVIFIMKLLPVEAVAGLDEKLQFLVCILNDILVQLHPMVHSKWTYSKGEKQGVSTFALSILFSIFLCKAMVRMIFKPFLPLLLFYFVSPGQVRFVPS